MIDIPVQVCTISSNVKLACSNIPHAMTNSTNLINATKSGDLRLVRSLLKDGICVDSCDKIERTALMFAAKNSCVELSQVFIDAGASVDSTDNEGRTALMFAVVYGKTEVVTTLIKAKACVDISDKKGRTALMWAAKRGKSGVAQVLIDAEARVDSTDNEGHIALDLTREERHLQTEKILLETFMKEVLENTLRKRRQLMENNFVDKSKLGTNTTVEEKPASMQNQWKKGIFYRFIIKPLQRLFAALLGLKSYFKSTQATAFKSMARTQNQSVERVSPSIFPGSSSYRIRLNLCLGKKTHSSPV